MTAAPEPGQAGPWGPAPWAPPPLGPPSGRAEVVVIGGGFAGLSTALHLVRARPGLDVRVLEVGRLGAGASGRATGMLGPGVAGSILDLEARLGPDGARRAFAATLAAVEQVEALVAAEAIDCALEPTGQLHVALCPRHAARLGREAERLAALGFTAPLLDRAAVRRAVGTDAYHAALRLPGALLDPVRLLAGLARAAAARGVRLHEGVRVARVEPAPAPGRDVRVVCEDPAGRTTTLTAPRVVVATNAGLPGLGLLAGRVVPLRAHALVTAPLGAERLAALGWAGREALIDRRTFFHYARLTPDGRLLLGGGRLAGFGAEGPRFGASAGGDAGCAGATRARLVAEAEALFPALRPLQVDVAWSGPLAFTNDRLPVVGPLADAPGVLALGGWCGHGLALSVSAGAAVAEAVVRGAPPAEQAELPWWRGTAPVAGRGGRIGRAVVGVKLRALDIADRLAVGRWTRRGGGEEGRREEGRREEKREGKGKGKGKGKGGGERALRDRGNGNGNGLSSAGCGRFLWGTALSGHQAEGGLDDDWTDFERRRGLEPAGDACDFWRRYPEDLDLARSLGTNALRLSLEWSRLEPSPGRRDRGAARAYERVLAACRDRGLAPVVTLSHFTLPRWAADAGGWLAPEVVRAFGAHAAWVARRFGPHLDLVVTLNEPNVRAGAGYLAGVFPPGRRGRPDLADRCLLGQVQAHVAAWRALKGALDDRVRVAIAPHLVAWSPGGWRDPLGLVARAAERFNWAVVDALATGRLALTTRTIEVDGARDALDVLGVNYFAGFRADLASFLRFAGVLPRPARPGTSDLGWPIDPAGFEAVLVEAARRGGRPIVVTENGVADATDRLRPAYLAEHLAALDRARARGADVRGYLHWSLLDNVEWHEGRAPRFGLFAVDYATQRRTPRPSAAVYARELSRRSVVPIAA